MCSPEVFQTLGVPFEEIVARQESLAKSQEKDMKWLNHLHNDENPMEWIGFNNNLASEDLESAKPASIDMVWPLLDSPPAHYDTVLTSMEYMKKSLTDMGMKCAYLSPDMQLFMVASEIKWNDIERFRSVILRPGVMHIIQSACGAVGKLIRNSGIGAGFADYRQ